MATSPIPSPTPSSTPSSTGEDLGVFESALNINSPTGSGESGDPVVVVGPPQATSPHSGEDSPPVSERKGDLSVPKKPESCKEFFLGRVSNLTQEVVYGVGHILVGVVAAFAHVISGLAHLTIGLVGALFGYEAKGIEKAIQTWSAMPVVDTVRERMESACASIKTFFDGK